MTPSLKRGAAFSAGLHLVALLALIITIPWARPLPPPEDTAMEMDFDGDSANAQKSDKTGKVAAPTEADTKANDTPALEKPKDAPLEPPAPPPPPPPPPPPQDTAPALPRDIPPPPPPTPTPTVTPVKPPPPAPKVKPPPKPVTPPKLQTLRTQPNETKNPAPDTRSLDNTLDKLLADQKQVKPPTHRYNPERGGARDAGGSRTGNLTGQLSKGQQKQIGDQVRRCYSEDTAARDYASYVAVLTVTIDASGEARLADLSDADKAHANADPAFRAFAERAQRAVLDPTCSKLPVPPDLLGKPSAQLTFRFRP